MLKRLLAPAVCLFVRYIWGCVAQSTTTAIAPKACRTVLKPQYPAPLVGPGYVAQIVANRLWLPRGLVFDSRGALLVVLRGIGIAHISFVDEGGTCLAVNKITYLSFDPNLNHAIELSDDSRMLYASTTDKVYSWAYDPDTVSVSQTRNTLVQNMYNVDHITRTLLLSRKVPGLLLVSRGSGGNIDPRSAHVSAGRSMIRAFNISNLTEGQPYDFPAQGRLIAWGLRNSVGVAEEPTTGGIFSVENGYDFLTRMGRDIHEDNPGEEMNFHGYLTGPDAYQGRSYGYPHCFALWDANIPDRGNKTVGDQLSINPNTLLNDTSCARDYVAPRLTFEAHMAPLDIKFDATGTLAYVTFHGSNNRVVPKGCKVSAVVFSNGQPVEPADSTTAAIDILSSPNMSLCPLGCVRPAGLAIDRQGRIFMSSDITGEIYVLQRVGAAVSSAGSGSGGSLVGMRASAASSSTAAALSVARRGRRVLIVLALALSVVGGTSLAVA